jgi:hypothetical protein
MSGESQHPASHAKPTPQPSPYKPVILSGAQRSRRIPKMLLPPMPLEPFSQPSPNVLSQKLPAPESQPTPWGSFDSASRKSARRSAQDDNSFALKHRPPNPKLPSTTTL